MLCLQKKDVDVQTSLEQIDVHDDMNKKSSTGEHGTSLPSYTTAPDEQCHLHPGVDVHTLPATEDSDDLGMRRDTSRPESGRDQTVTNITTPEISDDSRLKRDMARPESGRDQTVYHSTGKHHHYAERDIRHQVPLPSSRTTSVRPGIAFDEDSNGTVSTRSVMVDPSSGTHKPSGGSEVQQNRVTVKKLPSSEATVPSRSAGHDREPSVGSRTRVPAETDDENMVPSQSVSQNRGPAYHTISSVSDSENRVPHSRKKVPFQSVDQNRGPLYDSHTRVPADSDNDYISRERVPSRSAGQNNGPCLLYTSPSPRDGLLSRMPSSA